jgi:hypothetical protein
LKLTASAESVTMTCAAAIKFLARSIVTLWYLGSWYEPKDLKKQATAAKPDRISSEVVSPNAYTQGLVWQIAGAHPMGYSNLQFGYWSRNPPRSQ